MRPIFRPRGQHWSGLSMVEGAVLLASLVLVTGISASVQQRLLDAAQLHRYRSTMRELTNAVRAMPSKAKAQRRTMQLQVDAAQRALRITSLQRGPRPYERIEETIWLPEGLEVSELPTHLLSADPTGKLSASSILIAAPAHRRLFRVSTGTSGVVQLNEEPSL